MRISVRRADSDDLGTITAFLAEGSAQLLGERGGPMFVHREAVAPSDEGLLAYVENQDSCAVIGAVDGAALGIALARLDTLRDGERVARLEWLWVDPGARQVGLGAEMMDELLDWADECHASSLDAYALPGDREAKNFLESAGFSARLLVMNRRLSR